MNDAYISDIARAADNPLAPSPDQLRAAQAAKWARHHFEAWRIAPIATLTGEHVARGAAARARRIERSL